jgi:hypothetical protein
MPAWRKIGVIGRSHPPHGYSFWLLHRSKNLWVTGSLAGRIQIYSPCPNEGVWPISARDMFAVRFREAATPNRGYLPPRIKAAVNMPGRA